MLLKNKIFTALIILSLLISCLTSFASPYPGYPIAESEPESYPIAERGYPIAESEPEGYPIAESKPESYPIAERGYPIAESEPESYPIAERGYPIAEKSELHDSVLCYYIFGKRYTLKTLCLSNLEK
ncbi:3053_t:CDS:2 [Entrophospora sp. SA101]|nr:3053_t:CDS:2 [Entrophospora sp. SA101]